MQQPDETYVPGVCNIGPAEIARRRQAGHVGATAAIGLLLALLVLNAPRPARLLVAIPAAGAASGYLQARLRFCAGFGSAGVYNFGTVGSTVAVLDPDARARDRRRSLEISATSGAIGLLVAFLVLLLPRR